MTDETKDEAKTLLTLDQLNEMGADTVEAAPEFVDPPKGRYACLAQAKFENFKKEDRETGIEEEGVRIRVIYSIDSVAQLKDPLELQPAKGSLFSETFMGTAEGLRYFKTRAQGILGDLGNAKWGEVIAAINGHKEPFLVDIGRRTSKSKDKDGNEKTYENLTIKVVGEKDEAAK